MDQLEQETINVVANSQRLMAQMRVSGYPTLIAEVNEQFLRLAHTAYYKKVADWQAYLATLVQYE